MALSKPIYSFLGFYFEQLFNHPIRTKSITSSIIASSGAIVSQQLSGGEFNPRSVFAFSMFGLCIAGPFAHFFYTLINNIVPEGRSKKLLEFLLERCAFAPIFCCLSLFFLTLFEGKTIDESTANVLKLYRQVLIANWRYLTFPVFLNFNFVPPMLRVFVSNIIGFFWIIYLADKRRRATSKKSL